MDIIEIDRMREALRRRPGLALRLFTERERDYCRRRSDPAPQYAARFAAKEAAVKAVGRWLRWHEVEVLTDGTGRPRLHLSGPSAVFAGVPDGAQLLVSMSHSRDYAIACVALVAPESTSGALGNPKARETGL